MRYTGGMAVLKAQHILDMLVDEQLLVFAGNKHIFYSIADLPGVHSLSFFYQTALSIANVRCTQTLLANF